MSVIYRKEADENTEKEDKRVNSTVYASATTGSCADTAAFSRDIMKAAELQYGFFEYSTQI